MKSFALIVLGTLVFLSSEGWAGKNNRLPNLDKSPPPPLVQKQTNDHSFDDLIQNGRPGGFSPHGDHLGDLLRGTPQVLSGDSRLLYTRGQTFYIPSTSDKDLETSDTGKDK